MTAVQEKPADYVFGRPTKYRGDQTVRQVIACARRGFSHRQIAQYLGIASPTLYDWDRKYPDFSNALAVARDSLVARYENALLGQAEGRITGGNSAAAIFMLKNLASDEYRDRREHKIETEEVGTIDIDFSGFDEDAEDAEFYDIEDDE